MNKLQNFKQNSQCSANLLELYQYHLPMEKHLGKIMEEISNKEDKIKELKFELDQIDSFVKEPVSHINLGPICHKCHQRSGHKSLHCKEVACNTWKQCGHIHLHKAKKKRMLKVNGPKWRNL